MRWNNDNVCKVLDGIIRNSFKKEKEKILLQTLHFSFSMLLTLQIILLNKNIVSKISTSLSLYGIWCHWLRFKQNLRVSDTHYFRLIYRPRRCRYRCVLISLEAMRIGENRKWLRRECIERDAFSCCSTIFIRFGPFCDKQSHLKSKASIQFRK